MPKRATGTVRFIANVWTARIRFAKGQRPSFQMIWAASEDDAKQRAVQLSHTARKLSAAEVDLATSTKLLAKVANAASTPALEGALIAVDLVIARTVQPIGMPKMPTFRALGERWTSGELAKRYPDQVKLKRSAHNDVSRLTQHVYPVIGAIPIDKLTLDDCEAVMRQLPTGFAVKSRRNVGALVARLFAMAVYPLRLISHSPIPRGFLPRASKRKALAYVFPDEDRRLMACTNVPLEFRMLWGVLIREGLRSDEALSLVWSDLDLARGYLRLDRNKTADPRSWALSSGVAEALSIVRLKLRPHAQPSDYVFLRPEGHALATVGGFKLPGILRRHLRAIGLDKERAELFTTTEDRRRIRVHDLRSSFVTISLANGRSESWICDRTGHRSSTMLAAYKRTARMFEELDLGDLIPLNEAIPELAAYGPGLDHTSCTASESHVSSNSYVGAGKGIRKPRILQGIAIIEESSRSVDQTRPRVRSLDHSKGHSDDLTAALQRALELATQAGNQALAHSLELQLEALQVVRLSDRRRRRRP